MQPDPNEELFDSLNSVHMDPALSRVFAEMNIHRERLKEVPQTSSEINRLMSELDAQWRVAMHRKGKFTGIAQFPDETKHGHPMTEKYYEDQAIIFRGVYPTEIADGTIETYDTEETKFYDLKIQLSLITVENGKEHEVVGSAAVENIAQLDIDGFMSLERARHTLRHFQPELFARLGRLFGKESQDECETILRLNGTYYDAEYDKGEDADQIRLALYTYSNYMQKFDGLFGYVVGVNGMGWAINEEGQPVKCNLKGTSIVKVHALDWHVNAAFGDDTIVPHIVVSIGGRDLGDQSKPVLIPIRAINTFESQRHTFYNAKTE